MRTLRIALDLDGTTIGHRFDPFGQIEELAPRPGMVEFMRAVKHRGHTLILWTHGTSGWVQRLQGTFPECFELFDEVYTRDTHPAESVINGRRVYFKDVRRIGADLLIDDELSFLEIGQRLGLGKHYYWLREYVPGEAFDPRHLKRIVGIVDHLLSHERKFAKGGLIANSR